MVSVKIQCRIFYTIKNRSKNDVEKKFFLVFLKLFLELRYGSRNFKTHILPFYRSTIEIWSTVNGHIEELVIIWLPEDDYPSPWGGPHTCNMNLLKGRVPIVSPWKASYLQAGGEHVSNLGNIILHKTSFWYSLTLRTFLHHSKTFLRQFLRFQKNHLESVFFVTQN